VNSKRLSSTRPVLPPDPLGDALAACFRQLLAQLAMAEKSTSAVSTVEGDGPGFDQPSLQADLVRET
jgi:hypothetical protein